MRTKARGGGFDRISESLHGRKRGVITRAHARARADTHAHAHAHTQAGTDEHARALSDLGIVQVDVGQRHRRGDVEPEEGK